jgi:cytochrome d ubiquinol oxidase subunit I
MNPELLSRLQFALTVSFHFIYPPLSMGLGVILVVFGFNYLRGVHTLRESGGHDGDVA